MSSRRDVEFNIKGHNQAGKAFDEAGRQAQAFSRKMADMERFTGRTTDRFGRQSRALKLNNQQLQNMSFQMNDMAVMLASGQSPFTMIMQQGMQIGQIFGPGATVQQALRATGAGLVTFLTNPITLAIGATAILAGGVKLMFQAFSGPDAKNAEETLKNHKAWITSLESGYAEAARAAKAYQQQSAQLPKSVLIAEGRDSARALQAQFDAVRGKIVQGLERIERRGKGVFDGPIGGVLRLAQKFRDGELTARGLQAAMGKMRIPDNLPAHVLLLVKAIQEAAGEASVLEGAINGVRAATESLSSVNVRPFGDAMGIGSALKDIRALAPELRDARARVEDIYKAGAGQARTIGEAKALATAYRQSIAALDEQERREKALDQARKSRSTARAGVRKAETEARRNAAQAMREAEQFNRNQSIIDGMMREVEVLQMSGSERQRNLVLLKQEQAVRAAIARLGKNADEGQIARVKQLVPQLAMKRDLARKEAEELQRINALHGQAGTIIGNSIAGAIKGTEDLEGAAIKLALAFAQAAIQAQIVNSFGKNSATGSFLTNIFSSLLAGFRADGGPVNAGQPYMVGERGKEVFVPDSAGRVISNAEAFGSRSIASGGKGGAADVIMVRPEISIINNTPAKVSTHETGDGKGGRRTEIIIDEMTAKAINTPGSASSRALRGQGRLVRL